MNSSRVLPLWFGAVLGLAFALAVLLVWGLSGRPGLGNLTAPEEPGVVDTVSGVEAAPAPSQPVADEIAEERQNAIVRAFRRAGPAVVSISTVRSTGVRAQGDIFGRGRSSLVGLGSGILVDHEGYVLTANHIVAGSEQLQITLPDGQSFDGELVGANAMYDLAVIKIAGTVSGLPVAPLGDSDRVTPGEWAIAVGSPFGYLVEDTQPTVTVGVISAVNRSVQPRDDGALYRDMLQTDALINPGNSGGPLLNVDGEVIGINTTVITDAGGGRTGLSFAIPINRGKWVMQEILEYGRVRPFLIGFNGAFLDRAVRKENRISDETPDGFLIRKVESDSPASRAGLREGDVVTHVDGHPFVGEESMAPSLFEARVGSTLALTVWREGDRIRTTMTLDEAPNWRN